nr:hypothetical protein BaRGS_030439 [Batillaria attramentaria]
MLRDKRWDVISNAVLCRVWEDVRRSVLKAAVEQREWTTVKHMADHSLYDDERNWALMEAFYQGRWSVVIALAEFGHDRDQARVMEHGVDDEERRQVMWEALDRREGSVVAHIISIMEDRVTVEERERVFQQALSQGVWQALKRLAGVLDTMHIIVARGGDPLAVTRQGETILTLAVMNRKYLHELLAECIKLGIKMLYESGSCSNRELYNIAQNWFDPANYTDSRKLPSLHSC